MPSSHAKNGRRDGERGVLLLEVLLVTALAAIVLALGAELATTVFQGGRTSSDVTKSASLASEAFEGMQAAAVSQWSSVADIADGATVVHPEPSGASWVVKTGEESVSVGDATMKRRVTVTSVSRDPVTRAIEAVYVAAHDDPAIKLLTIRVESPSGTATSTGYVARWRNTVCRTTEWSGVSEEPAACPMTTVSSFSSVDAEGLVGSIMVSRIDGKSVGQAGAFPEHGEVESSTIDTGIENGVSLNALSWRGALGGPGASFGRIRFALASSDDPRGPWDFVGGASCTSADWFESDRPEVPVSIPCASLRAAKRYVRYKVRLCGDDCVSTSPYSPRVDDILLNWSP